MPGGRRCSSLVWGFVVWLSCVGGGGTLGGKGGGYEVGSWFRETWRAAPRQSVVAVFVLTTSLTATSAAQQSWGVAAYVFVSSMVCGGAVVVLVARSRVQQRGRRGR